MNAASGDATPTTTARHNPVVVGRSNLVTNNPIAAGGQTQLLKKDVFELQHFHLLKCLEHTTVNAVRNGVAGSKMWASGVISKGNAWDAVSTVRVFKNALWTALRIIFRPQMH